MNKSRRWIGVALKSTPLVNYSFRTDESMASCSKCESVGHMWFAAGNVLLVNRSLAKNSYDIVKFGRNTFLSIRGESFL